MQIDVAELSELVLDNAAFLLAHRRCAAVQMIASQHPVDARRRRYRVAPLTQDGVDLVAVHAALAAGNNLRLDALRWLAPLTPFGAATARQQSRAALHIAVVILAEGLRAGSVVAVEIPHSTELRRPASLHRLVF